MAQAAVAVPVDVLAGEQALDGAGEVGLGAGAGLDQREAGRRVRNELSTGPL